MTESWLMLSPDGAEGGGDSVESGSEALAASIADFNEDSTADWAGDGKITSFKDYRQTVVPQSEFSKSQADLKDRTTQEATQAAHVALNQRFQSDPQFRAQLLAEIGKLDPKPNGGGGGEPSDLDTLLTEIESGPNKGWMNTADIKRAFAANAAGSSSGVDSLRRDVAGAFESMLAQNKQRTDSDSAAKMEARKGAILSAAQTKYKDYFEGDDGMSQLKTLYHGFEGSEDLDEFEPQFMAGVEKHIDFMGRGSSSAASRRAEESEGRVFAPQGGGEGTLLPRDSGGKPPDKRAVAQAVAAGIRERNRNA